MWVVLFLWKHLSHSLIFEEYSKQIQNSMLAFILLQHHVISLLTASLTISQCTYLMLITLISPASLNSLPLLFISLPSLQTSFSCSYWFLLRSTEFKQDSLWGPGDRSYPLALSAELKTEISSSHNLSVASRWAFLQWYSYCRLVAASCAIPRSPGAEERGGIDPDSESFQFKSSLL